MSENEGSFKLTPGFLLAVLIIVLIALGLNIMACPAKAQEAKPKPAAEQTAPAKPEVIMLSAEQRKTLDDQQKVFEAAQIELNVLNLRIAPLLDDAKNRVKAANLDYLTAMQKVAQEAPAGYTYDQRTQAYRKNPEPPAPKVELKK